MSTGSQNDAASELSNHALPSQKHNKSLQKQNSKKNYNQKTKDEQDTNKKGIPQGYLKKDLRIFKKKRGQINNLIKNKKLIMKETEFKHFDMEERGKHFSSKKVPA